MSSQPLQCPANHGRLPVAGNADLLENAARIEPAPSITDPAAPVDNPLDGSRSIFRLLRQPALADPYPFYTYLREVGPLRWDGYLKAWVVSGYQAVAAALRHPRLAAGRLLSEKDLQQRGLSSVSPLYDLLRNQLLFLDPPKHTQIRRVVSPAFLPQSVSGWEVLIGSRVSLLLDRVAGQGTMDLVADLAAPLPMSVVADLLDLPTTDAPQLKRGADAYAALLGNFQGVPNGTTASIAILSDLTEYFQQLIARRRRLPGADLISTMLAAQDAGLIGSDSEILGNCLLFLTGGHETTTNLIASGVLGLLESPEVLSTLSEHPEQWPIAVEELLRFDGPAQYTGRIATADLSLSGQTIKEGQGVILLLASANRDPAQWPDPDTIRLDRSGPPHLAFGRGIHFCLGASLARLEAQVALHQLFTRIPHPTLVGKRADLQWGDNANLRCPLNLPLTWTP